MTSGSRPGPDIDASARLVTEAGAERSRRVEAHAARTEHELRRAARRGRIGGLLLAILVPAFLVLAVLNLAGRPLLLGGRPAPPPGEHRLRLIADVSFAVEAIEAYRAQHGVLPPSLAAIDIRGHERWRYETLSADRYRVTLVDGTETVAFDSREKAAAFFAPLRNAAGEGPR